MILVLDASPLITLARIGALEWLRQLAEQIVIPDAVYAESGADNADLVAALGKPGREYAACGNTAYPV